MNGLNPQSRQRRDAHPTAQPNRAKSAVPESSFKEGRKGRNHQGIDHRNTEEGKPKDKSQPQALAWSGFDNSIEERG